MSRKNGFPYGRHESSVVALRSWVLQRSRKGLRRFLFSSCWRGEGTSTVLSRLIASLADISVKVAVFDLDFRSGRLSEWLRKRGPEAQGQAGVRLFWSAIEVPGNLQALRSEEFDALRRQAESWAEVVLYDAPALSISREVFWVPDYFDGAVLISHAERLDGYPEASLSEDLRDHSIELLGVVQTGV